MDRIEIYLIGTPRVYINGERYLFPYRRAEALFYYLVTKESENKNVLEDLFWGDIYDENSANRNFRNAVYRIRKDFGHDFLVRDGWQNLSLNQKAEVWLDIREFSGNLSVLGQADCLCYLHQFKVEHCAQFETWVTQTQQEYAEKIYQSLLASYRTEDCRLAEAICKKLIFFDDLCEKYYTLLLLIYGEMNAPELMKRTYEKLRETLMEELGVEPDEAVTKTYKRLAAAVQKREETLTLELMATAAREKKSNTKNVDAKDQDIKDAGKQAALGERSAALLEWIVLFLDPVSDKALSHFIPMEAESFDACVELLLYKSQIKEEEQGGKIYYCVTRSELREKIYDRISLTRRRRMHREVSLWLEKQFTDSPEEELITKLIYHFMRSGQKEKVDEYLNRYFYTYIEVSHDFFPVLEQYPLPYQMDTYRKNLLAFAYIMQQMEHYVEEYRETVAPASFHIGRVLLYARMLLWAAVKKPNYKSAWEYIRLLEDYETERIAVARQKAYIYINTRRAKELLSLSEEMTAVCKLCAPGQLGFWMRLRGMALLLSGHFFEGRRVLLEAVDFFMEEENQEDWKTNAAVAYSWIGDSYRLERDYENAGKYLRLSQSLTSKIHDVSGKTIIYLRMGQFFIDTGDQKEAEKYIRASVRNFEWLEVIWKRSTAYGCMALLCAGKGQWSQTLENLEKQAHFVLLVQDPYEKAFYYRILRLLLDEEKCPGEVQRSLKKLSQSLEPPLSKGCEEVTDCLPSSCEREYLRRLQELCNN